MGASADMARSNVRYIGKAFSLWSHGAVYVQVKHVQSLRGLCGKSLSPHRNPFFSKTKRLAHVQLISKDAFALSNIGFANQEAQCFSSRRVSNGDVPSTI
jgi:hypothetical protein